MKILMSAFTCGPAQGSEAGVGWHWAVEAAKRGHDVTVITQTHSQGQIERGNCQWFSTKKSTL